MTLRRAVVAAGTGAAVAAAVLVAWPPDDPAPARATVDPGRAVYARLGCGSCHTLAATGSHGQIGPDLDARLAHHTAASLRHVVLEPPGGLMPDDFGARTTDAELDALVAFLLAGR